jgi:hypothetical protein
MRIFATTVIIFLGLCVCLMGVKVLQQEELSLRHLTPDHYKYKEAEGCSNCKDSENRFMPRAAGVDFSSGSPVLDKRGWLVSVHARSQSHEDRVTTVCAWCHAPLTKGATQKEEEAKPIPKGTWQGVSCGACHPGSLARDKRISLLINFKPGTDPTKPESYVFRDRMSGKELNAQCRFCHHEPHDLLIEAKQKNMASGNLRCIDCHMAAYAVTNQHVERFHNLKVAENLPFSCSGGMGRAASCHEGVSSEWFKEKLPTVKGPVKEW